MIEGIEAWLSGACFMTALLCYIRDRDNPTIGFVLSAASAGLWLWWRLR